jgi:hypothetical protein
MAKRIDLARARAAEERLTEHLRQRPDLAARTAQFLAGNPSVQTMESLMTEPLEKPTQLRLPREALERAETLIPLLAKHPEFRTLGVQWLAPEAEHAYIDSATLTQAGLRHSPGYVLGVRLVGVPLYFHLGIKGRLSDFVLAIPYGELNVSDVFPLPFSFPGDDSGSKRFASLTDFREFWAGAQMPRVTFLQKKVSAVAYLVVVRVIVALSLPIIALGYALYARYPWGNL